MSRACSSSGTSGSGSTQARNAKTTSAPIRFAARMAAAIGSATRPTIAAPAGSAMAGNLPGRPRVRTRYGVAQGASRRSISAREIRTRSAPSGSGAAPIAAST